jgi:hypothetical protein
MTQYNTLTQTVLQKLFTIQGFGKRNFAGAHFSIKFRVPKDKLPQVSLSKARHPETLVHSAETTEFVIFGGTYSQQSSFINDCKRLLKLQVK